MSDSCRSAHESTFHMWVFECSLQNCKEIIILSIFVWLSSKKYLDIFKEDTFTWEVKSFKIIRLVFLVLNMKLLTKLYLFIYFAFSWLFFLPYIFLWLLSTFAEWMRFYQHYVTAFCSWNNNSPHNFLATSLSSG